MRKRIRIGARGAGRAASGRGRRVAPPDPAGLEARSFRQEIRRLGARDRRVVALILQRLAEIEATLGEAAADAALDGLVEALTDQRRPLAG